MKNKVKNLIKDNKKKIIKFLLIVLWVFLFIFNYITLTRLMVFLIILLMIFLFKQVIDDVKTMKPIKNIYLLILLINIDKIKLILINFIIYLYIFIFNLLEWSNNNKLVKLLEWILKSILINPLLMIIHKYYYLLYIWVSSSLRNIFLTRFYGMILVVLIFSPILLYIYKLLGYSILNVYILMIMISIIEDNYEILKEYKYIKYILLIIDLLKINKDISIIFEYRNNVSVLSILIKKTISQIKERNTLINNYGFYVNYIYSNILVGFNNDVRKNIIDYNSLLKNSKIMKMKVALVDNYSSLFGSYYLYISFEFDYYLDFIVQIEYYKLQRFYKLNNEDLIKLKKIEEILYLLVKLILFYFFNVLKLIGYSDIEVLDELKVNEEYIYYDLRYDRMLLLSNKQLEKIDKIIKNKDFYVYREFYEQMYLYTHLWDFSYYWVSNNEENNMENGINCNKYPYIDEYIDIFKNNTKIINEDWDELKSLRTMDTLEEETCISLNNYRNRLIKEWQYQSKDLSINNFYEKNNINLLELNNYVKDEIKRYKIRNLFN
jgi:hypothetical protein